jgi:uncharacterized protein (DUF2062 family)
MKRSGRQTRLYLVLAEKNKPMLMKRRKPPSWAEWLRVWIWPRRSWFRSGQYVTKRILRLTASPHAVAAGVAAGAFTSFTPFMGLHFLLAAILAWVIRGNLIASALGTFVGNPLTFPFIWAATYKTGQFILQADMAGAPPALGHAMKRVMSSLWNLDGTAAMTALSNIWNPILYPMLVGGLIVGPLVTIPMYFLTKRAALMFRESRRDKLMNKAAEIKARARAAASSNHQGQSA